MPSGGVDRVRDSLARTCVPARDLNRASPKDDFPLPRIDILVDNTAQHKVFSFMDGFSGYNQIKMAPERTWRKRLSSHSGARYVTKLCHSG